MAEAFRGVVLGSRMDLRSEKCAQDEGIFTEWPSSLKSYLSNRKEVPDDIQPAGPLATGAGQKAKR